MISKEQVEHMAKLARIELTEKEKEKFTKELSSILDYVEQLNRVKAGNVKLLSQVTGLKNVVRSDELGIKKAKPSQAYQELRNKILKETPKRKNDYYKVPKILE